MIMSTLVTLKGDCAERSWRKAGEQLLARLIAFRTEQARRRIVEELCRRSDADLTALGLLPDQIRCLREHRRLPHWRT